MSIYNNITRRTSILTMLILVGLSLTGCYHRVNCDSSDNKKLGDIDYSDDMKQWNYAKDKDSLVLVGKDKRIVLHRRNDDNNKTQRLVEEYLCESIDIKPKRAYSYYEYPNNESVFLSDSMLVRVFQNIAKSGDARTEAIYLGMSYGISKGVHNMIPVTNADKIAEERPFLIYHKTITVDGKELKDIWARPSGRDNIYYHKSKGIVALKRLDGVYWVE